MTPQKLASALQGQTAIANKVYEATPAREPWTIRQIQIEVKRIHGTAPDNNITGGCLRALVDAGLVKECADRTYQRTAVRTVERVARTTPGSDSGIPPAPPRPAAVAGPQVVTPVVLKTEPAANDARAPDETIGAISARLRVRANELIAESSALCRLADELDNAALAVEEQIAAVRAEYAPLEQLRTLLRAAV